MAGGASPAADGLLVEHTVWQQDDVDPAAVEQAMRALERERFQQSSGALPARALNLIAVVDSDYAGEITRRLDGVGRNAPSRTILIRVFPRRATLSARVTMTTSRDSEASPQSALNELVTIAVAERHLPRLRSIVDPMVMTDVPTLIWSPHGHPEVFESIGELAQTVVLDSSDDADLCDGLADAADMLDRRGFAVVDLAWLRATPWRQRFAAHYAPKLAVKACTPALLALYEIWRTPTGLSDAVDPMLMIEP